jgi:hypothetical protein
VNGDAPPNGKPGRAGCRYAPGVSGSQIGEGRRFCLLALIAWVGHLRLARMGPGWGEIKMNFNFMLLNTVVRAQYRNTHRSVAPAKA